MEIDNVIVWFDIPSLDLDRAVRFYNEILGKEIRVETFMGQRLGFFPMKSKEGVGGDIIPPDESFKPAKGGVRVYLNCAGKFDEILGRVEKAGGKIVRDKLDMGETGFMAVIEDTEGNEIGLHSPK